MLQGAPIAGRLETYGGGGFVVDMTGTQQQVNMVVDHLEKKRERFINETILVICEDYGRTTEKVQRYLAVCH